MPEQRMFPVAIRDALLTQIGKDTLDKIFSLDAVGISLGFDGHLLNSKHVHFVFHFETKDIRGLGLHCLASRKDRQVVGWPVRVV